MSTGGSGGGAEFLGGIYAELGLDEKPAVDKFNKIQAKLDQTKTKFDELFGQIAAGKFAPGPEMDQATVKLQHYQDVMKGLKGAQDRLVSANTTISTSMASVNQNSGQMGRTLLQLGYIADDAQYGQRGGRAA